MQLGRCPGCACLPEEHDDVVCSYRPYATGWARKWTNPNLTGTSAERYAQFNLLVKELRKSGYVSIYRDRQSRGISVKVGTNSADSDMFYKQTALLADQVTTSLSRFGRGRGSLHSVTRFVFFVPKKGE